MPDFFTNHDGSKLAYEKLDAKPDNTQAGLIFLGGFKSDMSGSKASFLSEIAAQQGRAFIRFDYFGHGQSEGDFKQGTISHWKHDVLHMLNTLADQTRKHIVIGSSMGGWLALLCALERPKLFHAIIGIAPAPDFTEKLMFDQMSEAQKQELETQGYTSEPSDYEEDYYISHKLILDGRKNLLLDDEINITCPVHILQGKQDTAVPHEWAERIKKKLTKTDAKITYIEDGDHSLSREQDLALLKEAIEKLT